MYPLYTFIKKVLLALSFYATLCREKHNNQGEKQQRIDECDAACLLR